MKDGSIASLLEAIMGQNHHWKPRTDRVTSQTITLETETDTLINGPETDGVTNQNIILETATDKVTNQTNFRFTSHQLAACNQTLWFR
jgi:hypothetical protein